MIIFHSLVNIKQLAIFMYSLWFSLVLLSSSLSTWCSCQQVLSWEGDWRALVSRGAGSREVLEEALRDGILGVPRPGVLREG